jgi:hypothetical protein
MIGICEFGAISPSKVPVNWPQIAAEPAAAGTGVLQ